VKICYWRYAKGFYGRHFILGKIVWRVNVWLNVPHVEKKFNLKKFGKWLEDPTNKGKECN
jgi:hypothetical protein